MPRLYSSPRIESSLSNPAVEIRRIRPEPRGVRRFSVDFPMTV
jgi:hypothetical protein